MTRKRTTSATVLAATLSLALGAGCGEDGGELYCDILLPLAVLATQQGSEGQAEYCLQCDVTGETYLVVNDYYEGIEAFPIEGIEEAQCGTLWFRPSPTVPPGDYVFHLAPYTVDEYGEYGGGDYGPGGGAGALGPSTASITLTVTGEDCANGVDDDDDGAADCDDQDNCAFTPGCF